jgi:hypothetical protein
MSVIIINLIDDVEEQEDNTLVCSNIVEEEEMYFEDRYEGYLELQLMPIYEQK